MNDLVLDLHFHRVESSVSHTPHFQIFWRHFWPFGVVFPSWSLLQEDNNRSLREDKGPLSRSVCFHILLPAVLQKPQHQFVTARAWTPALTPSSVSQNTTVTLWHPSNNSLISPQWVRRLILENRTAKASSVKDDGQKNAQTSAPISVHKLTKLNDPPQGSTSAFMQPKHSCLYRSLNIWVWNPRSTGQLVLN